MTRHEPVPEPGAPDVSARLAALLEEEPPFERSLSEATTVAMHRGYRRRVRARALTAAAVVCLGVGGTAVVAGELTPPHRSSFATSPTTSATPSPTTRPTTSASPSPTGLPTAPATSAAGIGDRVHALALAIASPAGPATVTAESPPQRAGQPSPYLTELRVSTPHGPLRVSVDLDPDQGTSVALLAESCRLDNGGQDSGRRCTQVALTDGEGLWTRTYPDQPGRTVLQLAATAPDGLVLHVVVDNYVERADGSKTLGPSWQSVGITPAGVRALVQQSGLLS